MLISRVEIDKMLRKSPKYISLKEASRISGYSSDYLGWLIRKGKIEGKKVYLNTSWKVLTAEILKYCKNRKDIALNKSFFNRKYLSLKSAAKISGYAPDYVGQLIRSGKIKGKKVHSGIAWLIDEKVLKRYLRKLENNPAINSELLKNKQYQKKIKDAGLIRDIFPPEMLLNVAREITGWKSYENKTAKIFGIGWRFSLAVLIFLVLIGLGPMEIFQKMVKAFSPEEKQVVNFYPANCYGGWQNSQNAQGEPTANHENNNGFDEINSAVLKNSIAPIFCEEFAGETIENADIKKFRLKFSLAFKEESDESIIPGSVDTNIPFQETPIIIDGPGANSEEPSVEELTPVPSTESVPNTESVPAPAAEPAPSSAPAPGPESFFRRIINSVFAQEETAPPENQSLENNPLPVLEEKEPLVETDLRIEETENNENVSSSPETIVPEEIDQSEVVEEIPAEEKTTEEFLVEKETIDSSESSFDVNSSSNAFLEVYYTLDGENWQSLGSIGRDNLQNISFEIPLSYWEDIGNLQIKIDGLMAFDSHPIIYLDSAWIEVEYEEFLEEAKLTQEEIERLPRIKIEKDVFFKVSKEDFQLNEKPEFEINTSYFETEYSKTPEPELMPSASLIPVPEETTTLDTVPFSVPDLNLDTIQDNLIPDNKEGEEFISDQNNSGSETINEENTIEENVIEEAPVLIEEPEKNSDSQNLDQNLNNELPENNSENQSSSFLDKLRKLLGFNTAIAKTNNAKVLNVKILDPSGTEIYNLHKLKRTKDGIKVQINKPANNFRPGKYKVFVDLLVEDSIFYSEEEFAWGVLAINIDRSIELPGNDAFLQFGVLNDKGYTICNAGLDLSIESPSGQTFKFTTEDGSIVREEKCGPNNLISVPDYYAHFSVPGETGSYSMTLTGHTENGDHTITDSFEVRQSVEFDIVRSGPTRINPSFWYPVNLSILSSADWQGTIVETVPVNFEIDLSDNSIPYDRVEIDGDQKNIYWDVLLRAGVKSKIGYSFDAPDVSPEFYLLGPLRFIDFGLGQNIFQEVRQWQIASDLTCNSQAGGSGSWNNAASWSCARIPTTADAVVITTNQAITVDVNTAAVTSITINTGATLSADASSRIISLAGTFTRSGTGVFTANNSTVSFTSTSAITLFSGAFTGSNALYNLRLYPAITVSRQYTGGAAIDVTNNFLVGPASCSSDTLTYTLGGATTVGGTLTIDSAADADCGCTVDTVDASGYTLTAKYISLPTSGGTGTNTLLGRSNTIVLTGTTGDLFTNAGTFTEATSTISVESTSGTPDIFSAAETVYILQINAPSATVINAGANITTNNTAGNKLYVKNGVFNQEARTITPGTSGTLQIDSTGTLCLGGTTASTTANCLSGAAQTTAQAMPAFSTFTFDDASTVRYLSDNNTTISATPTYGNLELKPKFVSTSYAYTFDGAVTIDGDFTINPDESGAGTPALTVNPAGKITLSNAVKTTTITRTNSATATLDLDPGTDYDLETGLLNIDTGCTLDATSSASIITLKGTTSTLFTRAGTFTQGQSDVQVTSGSGNPTLLSAATTFHILTINASSATVINMGAFSPTIENAAGSKLYIQAGVFNASGASITGPGSGNGTLQIDSGGTLCFGGATTSNSATCNDAVSDTTTRSMPTFQTYTFDDASNVIYLSDADTAISSTPTYGNLYFYPILDSTNRAYAFSGAVTIDGDFTINPNERLSGTPRLTVNPAGKITLSNVAKTTTITAANSATSTLDLDPGTDYDLETGLLNIGTGGTLDATSSASVITLKGTSGITPLFTRTGTFTQGQSDVQVTSGSGAPTLLSAATTFHKLTINSGATVVNMGAAALTINNASGAQLYVQAGVFNASGASITGPGSGNGTLQIDSTGTLCLGGTTASNSATCNDALSDTTTRSMPTFQTYTFDDASKVIFLSDADTAISATPTYGNLYLYPVLISTNRAYTFGGAVTIDGDFAINPNELALSTPSLTVNAGDTITVSSTKTTTITRTNSATATLDLKPSLSSYDLSVGKLIIGAGGVLDAGGATSAIGINGSLYTNAGTFTAGNSIVTLGGSVKQTLSGTMTGTSAFYNLIITNNSGASATDCERTGFTASVDFDSPATITNIYTIRTSNVRVEYENAAIYAVNNFQWQGTAGSLIYFRNSVAGSGQWLLNVSGTQVGLDYVDVSRSNANGGNQIEPLNGTGNVNCGNNDNWNFFTPAISFSLSSNSLNLGTLSTLIVSTQALTASVSTNAPSGYVLYISEDGNLRQGSYDIDDVIDGTVNAGFEEYGMSTGAGDFVNDAAITGSLKIANQNASPATEDTTCIYKASISTSTVSGFYSHINTYIVTGRF